MRSWLLVVALAIGCCSQLITAAAIGNAHDKEQPQATSMSHETSEESAEEARAPAPATPPGLLGSSELPEGGENDGAEHKRHPQAFAGYTPRDSARDGGNSRGSDEAGPQDEMGPLYDAMLKEHKAADASAAPASTAAPSSAAPPPADGGAPRDDLAPPVARSKAAILTELGVASAVQAAANHGMHSSTPPPLQAPSAHAPMQPQPQQQSHQLQQPQPQESTLEPQLPPQSLPQQQSAADARRQRARERQESEEDEDNDEDEGEEEDEDESDSREDAGRRK